MFAKKKDEQEIVDEVKDGVEEVKEEEVPPITTKELKALGRAKYDEIRQKFDNIYVLRNKRTKQVVELVAASSVHACKIIGWRPRLVEVIETKVKEKEVVTEDEQEKKLD